MVDLADPHALSEQVEAIIRRWLAATGHKMAMAQRSLAGLQLARFLRLGYTEEQLKAVRRRMGRPMPLHELLVLDVEQRPSRFTRELAETGPEWYRPEVVVVPVPDPPRGTPAEDAAARERARERALNVLRLTREWIAKGCVGAAPTEEVP